MAKQASFDLDMGDFFKKAKFLDDLPKRAARACWTEATRISIAVIGLTPVATGKLRTTVAVDPAVPPLANPGRTYTVSVTAGDSDTPYAKEVHETAGIPNRGWAYNPEEGKPYQKSGQGKFLEYPFMVAAGGMEKRLARDIEGNIR